MVKKSIYGKYQLFNVAIELNRVTVKDANLLLSIDKFSEKFPSCAIFLLIEFFLGYNQVELDKESRDLTGFMIALGLMKMKTLLQRATNSFTLFVSISYKVLADHISNKAKLYLDDIRIKGSKNFYNN